MDKENSYFWFGDYHFPMAWFLFFWYWFTLRKNCLMVLCSSHYNFGLNAKIITCLRNNRNEYKSMDNVKSVFFHYIDFKNLRDIHIFSKLNLINKNIKNFHPNNNRFLIELQNQWYLNFLIIKIFEWNLKFFKSITRDFTKIFKIHKLITMES